MGRQSLSDRFWSRVDRSAGADGCWPWCGAASSFGHGYTWANGRVVTAHRVSWELSRGEIPPGLCVLHSCDVASCVNPSHLFLGTQAENMADMFSKGRQSAFFVPAGVRRSLVCRYGHLRVAVSGGHCMECERLRSRERSRQRKAGVSRPSVNMAALVAASNGTGSKPLGLEPVVLRRAGVSVSATDSAPLGVSPST